MVNNLHLILCLKLRDVAALILPLTARASQLPPPDPKFGGIIEEKAAQALGFSGGGAAGIVRAVKVSRYGE